MANTTNPMRAIYTKLNASGFKKSFIASVLPEWWDDEIASTPSGIQQASLLIGKLLGIRPETLWSNEATLTLSFSKDRKFKKRIDTTEDSLDVACAIAFSTSRLALRSFTHVFKPEKIIDASELRKRIINTQPWVALSDLLTYCTEVGIPVIFLSHFPKGAKKMAGLAFETNNRPVIVLTQSHKHGYMLFDLAHELGHISLGHVSGNKCVVDQNIDHESEDEDEKSANRFALELLTGDPDCKIVPAGRNLNNQELATAASRFGIKKQVDPLHVVLNYGYSTKHWPVAALALTNLSNGLASDQKLVQDNLLNNIDHDILGEDDLAVLKTFCGAD